MPACLSAGDVRRACSPALAESLPQLLVNPPGIDVEALECPQSGVIGYRGDTTLTVGVRSLN